MMRGDLMTISDCSHPSAGLAPHASDLLVENEERRVTLDLIEFYKKRAHELRAEYYRNIWRAVWTLLMRIGRR
jgi:hypothetical protein